VRVTEEVVTFVDDVESRKVARKQEDVHQLLLLDNRD